MRRPTQSVPAEGAAYESIALWKIRSGMSTDGVYKSLSNGNLRSIKLGKRTLIDVQHGLAWLASLPAAQIHHAPRKRAA
jgi:hypothetical protein